MRPRLLPIVLGHEIVNFPDVSSFLYLSTIIARVPFYRLQPDAYIVFCLNRVFV